MKKGQTRHKTLLIVAAIQVVITWLLLIKAAPLLGLNFGAPDILLILVLMVVAVAVPSMVIIFVLEKRQK